VGAASKDVTQRIEWVDHQDKTDFVIDFLTRASQGLVRHSLKQEKTYFNIN
jgi:hypothetical protein